jgi:hypothetical protein
MKVVFYQTQLSCTVVKLVDYLVATGEHFYVHYFIQFFRCVSQLVLKCVDLLSLP